MDKVDKKAIISTDDRYLTITAHHHRDMTAKELAQDLTAAIGMAIPRRTAYRRLVERALYAWKLVVYVPLNPSQKGARLLWSQEHASWAN
ncbi:hypothetical protein TNCV_4405981 [Trichonephila clavipes]|nr:hypothetical protein TNCV_4405981 [Trichonephila clavipes]